jgi:hypothetical protein
MANGLMGFPQFAPGGKGGLIPSIQMPQTRMSFPTPRGGGGSRAKVPAAAYLAPYLVSGGLGALLDRQQPTVEEQKAEGYYERYPEGETREAAILADQIYGVDPKQEKGFKGFLKRSAPVLADVLAGAAFGEEGGAQYGATASSIRQAKNLSEANRATRKQAFIAAKLKGVNKRLVNLSDANVAGRGLAEDLRLGIFDPLTSKTYVNDPEAYDAAEGKFKYPDFVPIEHASQEGKKWILPSDLPAGVSLQDWLNPVRAQDMKNFLKWDTEYRAKEAATVQAVEMAMDLDGRLQAAIADPATRGTTTLSTFLKVGESFLSNFEQIASLNGTRDQFEIFATEADIQAGRANGTGDAARSLLEALNLYDATGDENYLNMAISGLENSVEKQTGKSLSVREKLGDIAFNNVKTKALMLQLAYFSAAAYGQSGRTLSDKDLANFLDIVGWGSSETPEVLRDNLIQFVDGMIRTTDGKVVTQLSQEELGQYPLEDPWMRAKLVHYFDIPTNAEGDTLWDNYLNWEYKSFYDRYEKKLPATIGAWKNIDRTSLNRRLNAKGDRPKVVGAREQIILDMQDLEERSRVE